MKKIKINNKMAILVLFACIVTAFSFLKGSAVSSQKNEIKTNPDTEYQITYELNGGRFEGEYPKTFKISQETSIPNPIKDGSEFLGWTINDKTDVAPIKNYKIPSMTQGDIKLTANWKALKTKLMDGQTFNSTIKGMSGFGNVTEIRFIKEKPSSNGTNVAVEGEAKANIEGNVLTIASEGEIFANENCTKMFIEFYYIKDIKFNNFNTEEVGNFSEMFDTCTALVNLDVSMFNTSNATNMSEMFKNCQKLSRIDVSNFNTSNVIDMRGMFSMFEVSSPQLNQIIGLENFDTSKVTNMKNMFNGCENLQSLKIDKFNTKNITNMYEMFKNCKKLSGEITIMNPNITNYTSIFTYCSKDPSAKFIVKYISPETKEVARKMVATKTRDDNVFLDGESSTLLYGWSFNQKLSSMQNFANVKEIRFIQATPKSGGIDVSEKQDKSIMASIEGTILTVASESQIYANPNCTNMFNQYGYSSGSNKVLNKITFDNFNTSKVTNMDSMFRFCNLLTSLDLSKFDTSKVTNMNVMFRACNKLTEIKGIEKFDTSKVITSNYMFYNCGDLSGEITIMNPNVKSYTDMFTGCSTNSSAKFIVKYTDDTTKEIARQMVETKKNSTVIGNVFLYEETSILPEGQKFNDKIKSLSSFTNVTKVIFDYGIPSDISKYPNVDISENGNIMGYINGDTLYVVSNGNIIANTNSARLFAYCYNLKSIDFTNNFDTSQITQMNSMFETCTNLVEIKGVEKWNTNQVKDISYMFVGCRNLQNVNVSKFNTSKITNMDYTFKECNKLSGEITISNINTNYYREIFKDCSTDSSAKFIVKYTDEATKVVAERMVATKSTNSNVVLGGIPSTLMAGEQFNSTIKGMNGFANVTEIQFVQKSGTLSGTDVSETKDGSIKARISGNILYVEANGDIFANPDCYTMFNSFEKIQKIYFTNFNTSQVINMGRMFWSCRSLTSLDLSNFNTSNVTDVNMLFDLCQSLTRLDLSNFDTSNITDMSSMFNACYALKSVDLSNFNTSKVTNMGFMFYYCRSLTRLDLSNFDTSNVTNMSLMFSECESLTSLDLSNFNTSRVTNMQSMFKTSYKLSSIKGIENFNTSNVTNMKEMFKGCLLLNASLTIMNPNITEYTYMFQHCSEGVVGQTRCKFIINYMLGCKNIAQNMVNTKSDVSNVVLGTQKSLLNEDIPNKEEPNVPDTVILTIKDGNTTTTKEILAGEIGSLNIPSKEGMVFSGYFYNAEFTKPVSERDVISEDTTIYIKWEEVPQEEVPQNEEIPQEENKDESLEIA